MKTDLFNYDLPAEFIAQQPAEQRDQSRLLVLDRQTGRIEHRIFRDIAEFLGPGDVLVLNDTRVIRARLMGKRQTGSPVEVLLVREAAEAERPNVWHALIHCRRRLRDGEVVTFSHDLSAVVLGRTGGVTSLVEVRANGPLDRIIERIGQVPLPPYIRRQPPDAAADAADAERYQTVYARNPGAVAAPTAGLHFTHELLASIEARGCTIASVTLHVGPGTFTPVTAENVENHQLDREYYVASDAAADAINSARRVIAVGTTVCRVLETIASDGPRRVAPQEGWTGLFIWPPYRFRAVDALITNFHLPRSSLLMLVSAFAGRESVLAAYEEAKRLGYRFYSYGDAMLIL